MFGQQLLVPGFAWILAFWTMDISPKHPNFVRSAKFAEARWVIPRDSRKIEYYTECRKGL